MNANFNVSWSANWGSKKAGEARKLSAQEEYWLNRILRDHSKQIFTILALFFALNYWDCDCGDQKRDNGGKWDEL